MRRRGVGRSKPALAFVRGNIKGKEKRASARHTRRQRSRQRRGRGEEEEEEEESIDTREESEFKVSRGGEREGSNGSREGEARHGRVQERTKRRNVSGRDCVTAARRRARCTEGSSRFDLIYLLKGRGEEGCSLPAAAAAAMT